MLWFQTDATSLRKLTRVMQRVLPDRKGEVVVETGQDGIEFSALNPDTGVYAKAALSARPFEQRRQAMLPVAFLENLLGELGRGSVAVSVMTDNGGEVLLVEPQTTGRQSRFYLSDKPVGQGLAPELTDTPNWHNGVFFRSTCPQDAREPLAAALCCAMRETDVRLWAERHLHMILLDFDSLAADGMVVIAGSDGVRLSAAGWPVEVEGQRDGLRPAAITRDCAQVWKEVLDLRPNLIQFGFTERAEQSHLTFITRLTGPVSRVDFGQLNVRRNWARWRLLLYDADLELVVPVKPLLELATAAKRLERQDNQLASMLVLMPQAKQGDYSLVAWPVTSPRQKLTLQATLANPGKSRPKKLPDAVYLLPRNLLPLLRHLPTERVTLLFRERQRCLNLRAYGLEKGWFQGVIALIDADAVS
jgi:hypothetical protein